MLVLSTILNLLIIGNTPCPKGNTKKNGACVPCALGFYKDVVGDGPCTKCPTGRSTESVGSPRESFCGKFNGHEKELYS